MSTLTRRLAVIYSLTLTKVRCLSILTPADSPPTYSHTIRLTAIYSHSQAYCLLFSHSHSGSLPVYSHTIRLLPICSHTIWLVACVFSHQQTHCLPILTLSDSLPSILTPSGSLPIYSHTIRLAVIYSHTIRLTLYLFSHSSYCLSVFTPNAVKAFLLSSSPMYSCTLGLTAYVFSYSTSHLSSPTPEYLVPTIRFDAYLALVCCLAICHSQTHHRCIVMLEYCSCSYPSSHSDLLPIYLHIVTLYLCTLRLAAIQSCTIRLAYLILH